MTLNRLTLSLLLAISLPAVLAGCQSAPIKSPQQTDILDNTTVNTINPTDKSVIKEAQLMPWSAHYEWQLRQVINQNGNILDISNFTPITLQVEPSSISFYQGCEHYRLDFFGMSAPPYPYYSHLAKVPATGTDDNNLDNNTAIKEDRNIQTLFATHTPVRLNFELLPTSQLTSADFPHYNLLQTMKTGKTLVWQNEIKDTP